MSSQLRPYVINVFRRKEFDLRVKLKILSDLSFICFMKEYVRKEMTFNEHGSATDTVNDSGIIIRCTDC